MNIVYNTVVGFMLSKISLLLYWERFMCVYIEPTNTFHCTLGQELGTI